MKPANNSSVPVKCYVGVVHCSIIGGSVLVYFSKVYDCVESVTPRGAGQINQPL